MTAEPKLTKQFILPISLYNKLENNLGR